VFRLAGRYAESRKLLETLRARAEKVGYRPILADVLYYLGELEVSTGSASQGEATLRRAAHTAEAGRHDALAADAWILLIEIASQATGDLERAVEYAEHARAALDRLGRHTRLEGQYEQHMGILDWVRSRPEDALAHFAAARRLFEQLGDEEMVLSADEGTALIYEEQGKLEEALRISRSVLAGREKQFGPDHPHTALSYNAVASALTHLGRHEEALLEMNKVLAIRQRANGPDHFETAQALHNIGELLRNLGRYPESLDHHHRSRVIFEREFGSQHQHVAVSLEHTGGVHLDMGQVEEALPLLARALELFERALGEENLETVRARINLADGLRHAARHGEALEHDRRALAVMTAGMGTDNLYAAHAELGIGLDLVGMQRLAEAREPLERALATLQKIGGDPVALGKARFGLARALWSEPASRPRALELAGQAVKALTGAAGENLRLRKEATAWLRARSD
jgi:tetratricopeptide (TPR) repeat protein